MLNIGSGGQSSLVGYAGLPPSVDVPAVQLMPLFDPPMQLPPVQSGQGWMPAMVLPGSVEVSPVRKMTAESGADMVVAPVEQSTVPLGGAENRFITQTLVGVLPGFGTASGAPKAHPVAVQFLFEPVSADEAAPTVATEPVQVVIFDTGEPWSGTAYGRGTELPPPPV
jgi:hypothetical protein